MESELDMVITINNAEANQRDINLNRRFTELCGISPYRCVSGEGDGVGKERKDFIAHPTFVLREMMKREDWLLFAKTYFHWQTYDKINYNIDIPLKYILDTTGLLVKAAIEWLEKQEEV